MGSGGVSSSVHSVTDQTMTRESIDASRLDLLYRTHATRAKRTAFLLTGDTEAAADILHDAFVRLSGRFVDVRNPDVCAAYLRRTIVSLVRSRHRKAARERKHLTRHGVTTEANEPDVAGALAVRDALMKLGVRQRTAIVLRYYEDLPEAEIADALRCRPGTVKSLLSRGLVVLRADLER